METVTFGTVQSQTSSTQNVLTNRGQEKIIVSRNQRFAGSECSLGHPPAVDVSTVMHICVYMLKL